MYLVAQLLTHIAHSNIYHAACYYAMPTKYKYVSYVNQYFLKNQTFLEISQNFFKYVSFSRKFGTFYLILMQPLFVVCHLLICHVCRLLLDPLHMISFF